MGMVLLLKVTEAAAALAIGRSKLYELIAAGQIPVVKIGSATRVPEYALREFAERLEAGQGAER